MGSPRPSSIINPSTGQRRTLYQDGDTGDIIRVIMHADRLSGQFITPEAVERLQGIDDYHTLENIYWFVKKNVGYQADAPGKEEVRSPGYLFKTKTGDCKSMSVAIGALCRAIGIPFKYRFIRQSGARNYHHVYPIAWCRDGSCKEEVLLDAVHRSFNHEPEYRQKLDMKPGQRPPAGIGNLNFSWASVAPILLLLLLWFAFAKKVK